jgi:hypothetical protein
MKELISQLVAKADLDEAQAAKVAEVVRGQAKGLIGKLF